MPDPAAYFANLQRGTLLLNQNRPREALPFIQAAIAANPEAAHGYAELARCWNAIPTERGKAIRAIDRAIALAPNVSVYHGLKGWYLVCLMNNRAALKAGQQGLAINPVCPQSLNAVANAYTKMGHWKNAETACRRILAQDPHNAPGLNLLAQALRHLGRWKEARETVARLLANMPNNSFGHANAGYAALAAGDHLRANEHFLESLRLDPHFDLARRGLIASLRARIWLLRFNTRLFSWTRRPMSQGTAIAIALAFAFALILGGTFAATVNPAMAKIGGNVVACAVGVFFVYLYLSAVVGMMGNFLLMFDPLGRHALKRKEKAKACIPAIVFAVIIGALILGGQLAIASGLVFFMALLAFSIEFPLLKDRWLRRRESKAGQS